MGKGATHGTLANTKSVLVRLKQEYYDLLTERARANRRSLGSEAALIVERVLGKGFVVEDTDEGDSRVELED
jgi:hypothetical protein